MSGAWGSYSISWSVSHSLHLIVYKQVLQHVSIQLSVGSWETPIKHETDAWVNISKMNAFVQGMNSKGDTVK